MICSACSVCGVASTTGDGRIGEGLGVVVGEREPGALRNARALSGVTDTGGESVCRSCPTCARPGSGPSGRGPRWRPRWIEARLGGDRAVDVAPLPLDRTIGGSRALEQPIDPCRCAPAPSTLQHHRSAAAGRATIGTFGEHDLAHRDPDRRVPVLRDPDRVGALDLGVGVQPPTPSWGAILNEGKEFLALAPWVSLFPGGFIMLAVLSFNVLGDGLRDAFDPRAEMR